MCERWVREEGEGANRWGHGVSDGAGDALRGPRALELGVLACWADPEGRWAERGERKERDWASSRVGLAGWAGFWFPHLLSFSISNSTKLNLFEFK